MHFFKQHVVPTVQLIHHSESWRASVDVSFAWKPQQEWSTLPSAVCPVGDAWGLVPVPWGAPSQYCLALGPCSLHHCQCLTSAQICTQAGHTGSMFSASLSTSDIHTDIHTPGMSSHTGSMFSASLPVFDICTHIHTPGMPSHTGPMFSASLPASDICTRIHTPGMSSHTGSMFSASLPVSDICTHTPMEILTLGSIQLFF